VSADAEPSQRPSTWQIRLVGWPLEAATLAGLVLAVLLAAVPGGNLLRDVLATVGGFIGCTLLALPLGFVVSRPACRRLLAAVGRAHWGRWLLLAAFGVLVLGLLHAEVPLRIAFRHYRPALEQLAEEAMAASGPRVVFPEPRWVGPYRVKQVTCSTKARRHAFIQLDERYLPVRYNLSGFVLSDGFDNCYTTPLGGGWYKYVLTD
jgi:hypothetical protein